MKYSRLAQNIWFTIHYSVLAGTVTCWLHRSGGSTFACHGCTGSLLTDGHPFQEVVRSFVIRCYIYIPSLQQTWTWTSTAPRETMKSEYQTGGNPHYHVCCREGKWNRIDSEKPYSKQYSRSNFDELRCMLVHN